MCGEANKHDRCIGLLPGSREEAYDNMAYIMTVCEHIMTRIDNVVFVCAWVNALDLALLIKKTGWLLQVDNDYKILMSRMNVVTLCLQINLSRLLINQVFVLG